MRRLFGALCALAIVMSGSAAGAAVGGDVNEPTPRPLTVDPTMGPPGSTFTVSGEGCVGKGEDEVVVDVSAPDTVEESGTAEPNAEGAWSLTLTVPDDAAADSIITIDAACLVTIVGEPNAFQGFRGAQEFTLFEYDQGEFTVTAAPAPPATPVAETPTTQDPGAVDAAAAEATVSQPTFTG